MTLGTVAGPELASNQSGEAELMPFEVLDACLPHMPNGPLPHSQPGQWTPHVTLARRVAVDQLKPAMALRSVSQHLSATAVGLRHWDGNAKREYRI